MLVIVRKECSSWERELLFIKHEWTLVCRGFTFEVASIIWKDKRKDDGSVKGEEEVKKEKRNSFGRKIMFDLYFKVRRLKKGRSNFCEKALWVFL